VGFRGGVGDGDEGASIASQAATQLTALHALLPPWHCLQLLQVPVHHTLLSNNHGQDTTTNQLQVCATAAQACKLRCTSALLR